MKTSRKIVASIAVVGTIAAVALFNVAQNNNTSSANTFLAEETVDTQVLQQFNDFISEHGRNFLTKDEFNARLQLFKKNYDLVKQHNADSKNTFQLGINRFADLSQEEYEKQLGFKNLLDEDDERWYEEHNKVEEASDEDEGRSLQSLP